jgi:hypothetical protein
MDERTLFDRFHEALEMEPRPGAYERMRIAMTNHPVAVRRPVFRMRWSTMGIRVAAVLAAAVIAVAVGAAILAAHHGPVGSVNAGPDPSVKAYQSMISSNYNTMNAATSNHCNTMQDTGCEAGINAVIPTLQKWVGDLNSAQTPARFAFIDSPLRRHLNQVIADMTAAIAFQKAKNQAGFDLSMSAAFYERAWIDPAVLAIEGTYPRVAGSYHDAVSLARQSVSACVNSSPGPGDLSCARLFQQESCTGAGAKACEGDVQTAATQLLTFLIGLQENPAPGSLSTKDESLRTDLTKADTALLAITDALLSGDSAKATASESLYAESIVAANGDIQAIGIA